MKKSQISHDFHAVASDHDFQEALLKVASKRGNHLWSTLTISLENNRIILTRTFEDNVKESAEISASGYWESPISVFWGTFYKAFQKSAKHDTINLFYNIHQRFLGINGMENFCLAEGPAQFEIQFNQSEEEATTSTELNYLNNQILERIQSIDKENFENPPKNISALAKIYERDRVLTRLIKLIRGNKCQICGFSFKTKSSEDYSECHHLEHLANGGLDVSKNMLVLCPNHHRQAHFGNFEIAEHNEEFVKIKIDDEIYKCEL
ncbi:HNH endonuclease signature motif containing protein [Brachymonas denitrificans]|uniref:HNH endonuclease n=1 Tax=Brachymonas denitrificans TaxID=28220 RepID=UPI002AFFB0B7|nr:HNH endonuclease signature motif containing protein [Brachymonas denitrificans]